MVWKLLPRKLELVPKIIETLPRNIRKLIFGTTVVPLLLETEPRVIVTENCSKITNNSWFHY